MAAARGITCELVAPQKVRRGATAAQLRVRAAARMTKAAEPAPESAKIVLQPRVANLRSYGSGEYPSGGAVRARPAREAGGEISPFFASLADYIESSRKSQDFETLSGRLAMVAFAGTVAVELATGSSVFRKLDLREMAEGAALCMAVVACAAAFASASSARTRIGRMIELGYNTFVDGLIDNLVDGLFYDSELSDWSDEP